MDISSINTLREEGTKTVESDCKFECQRLQETSKHSIPLIYRQLHLKDSDQIEKEVIKSTTIFSLVDTRKLGCT